MSSKHTPTPYYVERNRTRVTSWLGRTIQTMSSPELSAFAFTIARNAGNGRSYGVLDQQVRSVREIANVLIATLARGGA